MTTRLPKYADSFPAGRSDKKTPAEINSNEKPISALVNFKSILISGIRETKVPITKPLIMNADMTANRARFSALEFSSSTLRVYYLPLRTISAAVAHFLDMEGVTGSIPVSSTEF